MSPDDIFGLSGNDLRIAICALKVMLVDGKVEKGHLARLTGHNNADSANRVWYLVKNKLLKTPSPDESASSLADVDNPTKGPKKTAAKMRTETRKKRGKNQAEDEEAGSEVDGKRAKKRVKKEVLKDAGVDMQDEI